MKKRKPFHDENRGRKEEAGREKTAGESGRRNFSFRGKAVRPGKGASGPIRGKRWRRPKPELGGLDTKVQTEVSAGGIVFKRTPRGVRVGFILDPYGKWGFAKGHVEAGEEVIDAAVRETMEEMGLEQLSVVAPLGTIDFWFRDRYRPVSKGTLVHKYVHYYLMEAPSQAHGRPQRKEKIRRIIWVGLRRAMRTSSYDDLRPVLERLQEFFRGEEPQRPAPPSQDLGDLRI